MEFKLKRVNMPNNTLQNHNSADTSFTSIFSLIKTAKDQIIKAVNTTIIEQFYETYKDSQILSTVLRESSRTNKLRGLKENNPWF